MLDIGFQELVVLMVIALLVFGPYKLPELGRALGRAMREFRRASDEFRSTIETNLNLTEDPLGSLTSTGSVATEASPAAGEPTPAAPSLDVAASPADTEAAGQSPGDADGASGEGAASEGSLVRPELVEPFCGPRTGRLVHRSTCAWAGRIAEWDRVAFKSAEEALELGRTRCPVCDP
jgi:TatA/E family protein of Tat protein translocase